MRVGVCLRAVGMILTLAYALLPVKSLQAAEVTQFPAATLRLPNGKLLTTRVGGVNYLRWRDIEINLQIIGVSPLYPYDQSVVGNHSQILASRFISTPNGRAWFALNERTPPAAAKSVKPTYEYWVAIERTSASTGYNVDYCIEAIVIGNRNKAKAEVLNLLPYWRVPASADLRSNNLSGVSSRQHQVSVTLSATLTNNKLARAIQTYLERVSEPALFKRFTIFKLTYDGKHQGNPVWTVGLDVEHQPDRTSAFNEGVNYRYVVFVQKNSGYIVTDLATGI